MRAALAVGGALLVAAVMVSAAACSDGPSPPAGSGNKVYDDVDATKQAPPTGNDGGGVFARSDAQYAMPDGYTAANVCKACACAATEFCFGGGPGYETFSGDCHPTTWGIGCQPLTASPCPTGDCTCLVNFLRSAEIEAGATTCYADCVQNYRAVYCPGP